MTGLRIAEIQEERRVHDAELARRLGTNQTQLTRLKNGDRRLTLDWLRRIAQALDCSVADLLSDTDVPARLNEDDRLLLNKMRAAASDPAELMELLAALEKFVQQQTSRRAMQGTLVGDKAITTELADLWAELNDRQRMRTVEMIRAAANMEAAA